MGDFSDVLIVTEGGGAKGLGHVYRSITLASQLPGARIGAYGDEAQELVMAAGLEGWSNSARVLIRDLVPPAANRALSNGKSELLVDIVDEADELEGAAELAFAAVGESAPGIFAGLRYAILRQEFADLWPPPWRRQSVVVCLGGVDPSRATDRIVGSIRGIAVHPVLGTGIGGNGSVRCALEGAALAVTSAGSTLLECAAMGVPALVVSHNGREEKRAYRMLDEGARWFVYLGPAGGLEPDAVNKAVHRYLGSPEILDAMSRAGRKAVDGCGAWRVGAILRRRIQKLQAGATKVPA
jgi:spore coat polysaccharide biosynthesis predicted glycosyltransferase SpsG